MYSQITNGLSALRIPNRFDLGGSPAMAQFLFCLEPFRWQETFFVFNWARARDDSHPNLLYVSQFQSWFFFIFFFASVCSTNLNDGHLHGHTRGV